MTQWPQGVLVASLERGSCSIRVGVRVGLYREHGNIPPSGSSQATKHFDASWILQDVNTRYAGGL